MKGVVLFGSGFVLGIIATILALFVIYSRENSSGDGLPGLTLFEEKGECITVKRGIKIFQVIKPNMALAETGPLLEGMIFIINYDNLYYYDDQEIKIPDGKCPRQVGIYQYTTSLGIDKTVPAVIID